MECAKRRYLIVIRSWLKDRKPLLQMVNFEILNYPESFKNWHILAIYWKILFYIEFKALQKLCDKPIQPCLWELGVRSWRVPFDLQETDTLRMFGEDVVMATWNWWNMSRKHRLLNSPDHFTLISSTDKRKPNLRGKTPPGDF